jgi:hypothetical protein
MERTDEACAIYINNIDCNAVGEEDIADWLKLLGEVRSVTRRYSTATKETGLRVLFRHATAANLAVQFLDGVVFRDKDRPLAITSTVFVKSTNAKDAAGGGLVDATAAPMPPAGVGSAPKVAASRALLPHNHLMPVDLQMDYQLVAAVPAVLEAEKSLGSSPDENPLFSLTSIAGCGEMFGKLCRLQEAFVTLSSRAGELEAQLEQSRAKVNRRLLASSADSGSALESVAEASLKVPFRVVASMKLCAGGVAPEPQHIFAALHDAFGPLARFECSPQADGSVSVTAEFATAAQATAALGALAAAVGGSKRPREETMMATKAEWLRKLGSWTEGAVRLTRREALARMTLASALRNDRLVSEAQALVDSWE